MKKLTKMSSIPFKRRHSLRALIYHECATVILSEVFDGVLDQLEDTEEALPIPAEEAWIQHTIKEIADRMTRRGEVEEAR